MQKTNPNKKIPTGWRKGKLGSACDVLNGSTPSTKNKKYWGDDVEWYTPNDLKHHKMFLSGSDRMISKAGLEKVGNTTVPKGSVILSTRAPIGYLGITKNPSYFNQGCKGLIPKTIESEFLYYSLLLHKPNLQKLGSGSTFLELNSNDLKKYQILLPPKPEQQKIAEILMAVDADIEKVGEIVAKTERLKKGLMQELFTVKKGWEEKTIKDVAKLRKEKFDPKKEDSKKYIGLEHIEQGTGQLLDSSDSNTTKSIKSRFQKGDILFNKLRPYLKKYWLADFDGVCTTELLVFTNKENILKEFLYYILSSDNFISFINSKTFGTKMPRADWSLLKDYSFYVPSVSKQKQIAETLSAIDQKIQINKTLQTKLINLKKGLMQDLLSGEVRVKI